MTRDEVLELAKQADLWMTSDERILAVERFAELVAAAEREAIVQMIESDDSMRWAGAAEAIRARGNK